MASEASLSDREEYFSSGEFDAPPPGVDEYSSDEDKEDDVDDDFDFRNALNARRSSGEKSETNAHASSDTPSSMEASSASSASSTAYSAHATASSAHSTASSARATENSVASASAASRTGATVDMNLVMSGQAGGGFEEMIKKYIFESMSQLRIPPVESSQNDESSRINQGKRRDRTKKHKKRRGDAAVNVAGRSVESSKRGSLPLSEADKIKIVDECWAEALKPREVAPAVKTVIPHNFFGKDRHPNPDANKIRNACRRRAKFAETTVLLESCQRIFGWRRAYDSQKVSTVRDIQEVVQMDEDKVPDFCWLTGAVFDSRRNKWHIRLAKLFELESGIIVAPEGAEDYTDPKYRKLVTMEDVRRAATGATRQNCMANAMSRKATERKNTITNSACMYHGVMAKTNKNRPPDNDSGKVQRNRYSRYARETFLVPIKNSDEATKKLKLRNKKLERLIKVVSCLFLHFAFCNR